MKKRNHFFGEWHLLPAAFRASTFPAENPDTPLRRICNPAQTEKRISESAKSGRTFKSLMQAHNKEQFSRIKNPDTQLRGIANPTQPKKHAA